MHMTTGDETVVDVVALGEALIRLSPPAHGLIEQAAAFDVHVGGSETNVLVGLARLGLRTAWLSRLTDNPWGRRIAQTLRGQGVDVSSIVWTDQDRVGLYFFESGSAPRASRVYYDRRASAMAHMQPHDLPADGFAAGRARLLHTSGITMAIGSGAAQTALSAVQQAKAAGW